MHLSPINQRRLALFKANRRGYWSFWVFLVLFVVSLISEFVANDKPILLSYRGELYMPVFTFYPETAFGGDFETEADYKDPYVQALIEQGDGWMLWPPIRYSYTTINYDLGVPAPSSPTSENWLGTDDQGRDVLARLLYGFRVSVLFGFTLTLLSSVIGVAVGVIQGYFGGKIDLFGQRFIEIWKGIPVLYVLIILASMFTPTIPVLLTIMLLFSWHRLIDVVRAEALKTRNFDFVRAARALGVREGSILFRHVLPNSLVAALTFLPFVLNASIITLTELDFLGFGLPPGSASLGELVLQGKNNPQAPWLGFSGFFVLALMLSLLTFIGEAVRDALDPRKVLA